MFLHNFISILVPPENALFSGNRQLTLAVGGSRASLANPLSYLLHYVAAPYLQGALLQLGGLRIHGYPRRMFSSVYARPFLVAGKCQRFSERERALC